MVFVCLNVVVVVVVDLLESTSALYLLTYLTIVLPADTRKSRPCTVQVGSGQKEIYSYRVHVDSNRFFDG